MLKKASITTLAAVFLALGISSAASAKVIYVDDDATGTYDGASWENAYNFLQDALMMASSGDEIRVAQGIYKPDRFVLSDRPSRGREETYQLINGVTLKGGYAGFGQPDPNVRDIVLYETILSGDLAGNDLDVNDVWDLWNEPSRAENSFHVVTGSGTDETAVLEGLTITNGYANGVELENQDRGGGVYANSGGPTVMNCAFSGNYAVIGGAMYNVAGNPMVANCTFIMNWSTAGGGVCNMNSSPTVSNCTFSGNYGTYGGGVYNEDSSPTLIDCTLSKNSAQHGGGICNTNSSPTLTTCTLSGNHAYFGGGLYCEDGSCVTVKDSIIEGNSANWGGGIYCHRYSLTIKNTTIRDNRVSPGPTGFTGLGGGIYCSYSHLTIADSVIARNQAREIGGGISSNTSELVLVNNIITANEAISWRSPGFDAGIFCSGSATLINNAILGNRARGYAGPRGYAPGEGGGISCWGGY